MTDLSKKKILIVDDEKDLTELLEHQLAQESFLPKVLNDPLLIMGVVREFQPDLLILDIMMPELSGIQVCRMLRADPMMQNIPILFLTAKGDVNSRILGLEMGADDYLSKPFEFKELLLRIGSLLRRSVFSQNRDEQHVVSIKNVTLNVDRYAVCIDGVNIDLTATEFKLLKLLMEQKGKVQSREILLHQVWHYESDVETRTVDTHIRRLREKLGAQADLIETVRGVGYRVVDV
jgi:two-component system phosphate regulon response regulator PhoB